jgi:hypothetical protein
VLFECPACDGTGGPDEQRRCPACEGAGRFKVTACPYETVDADVWELVRGADWVEQGAWPNGQGWLHEAACFVEGVRAVQREDAFARLAKKGR